MRLSGGDAVGTQQTPTRTAARREDAARMTPRRQSVAMTAVVQSPGVASTGKAQRQQQQQQQHTHTLTPTTPTMAECVQCHLPAAVHYCAVCLSERIISHHVNVRRVNDMRTKAKLTAETMLGVATSKRQDGDAKEAVTGTDPFRDPSTLVEPRNRHIDKRRMLRASRADLRRTFESASETTRQLRADNISTSDSLQQRREALTRRRATLTKAQQLASTHDATDGDVQALLPLRVANTRDEVAMLQRTGKQVALKLAGVRAILAQEVFAMFSVAPPSGTLAGVRVTQGREAGTGTPAARAQRSRERYVPGAFIFDEQQQQQMSKPREKDRQRHTDRSTGSSKPIKADVININDWTIMGLVLPLASDLKRFPRAHINGAIAHTIHLLNLLTAYLGLVVPFSISPPTGQPWVCPDALWGSGTKQSLYLSTAAYNALVASENAHAPGGGHGGATTGIGSMGASMMSTLGASTMSTLESFVQLPSGANLPWVRNVSGKSDGDVPVTDEAGTSATKAGATAQRSDTKTTTASKQFCAALTMLAYDVAYIAQLQGVQVDVVLAAGSPLRVLHKAVQSSTLGSRAHATAFTGHNVATLAYPQLDFGRLAQVHESGGTVSKSSSGGGVISSNSKGSIDKIQSPSRSSKAASTSASGKSAALMLDGSYIDARKAAESILDVRREVTPRRSAASDKAVLGGEEKRKLSAAARGVPVTRGADNVAVAPVLTPPVNAAAPSRTPRTLDFLRTQSTMSRAQQGTSSTKPATTTATTGRLPAPSTPSQQPPSQGQKKGSASPIRPAAGTVLFNGKEIKGKVHGSTTAKPRTSGAGQGKKKADEDDEWAMVSEYGGGGTAR